MGAGEVRHNREGESWFGLGDSSETEGTASTRPRDFPRICYCRPSEIFFSPDKMPQLLSVESTDRHEGLMGIAAMLPAKFDIKVTLHQD